MTLAGPGTVIGRIGLTGERAMISYEWRGDLGNAELEALHAEGFGHAVTDFDWRARLER